MRTGSKILRHQHFQRQYSFPLAGSITISKTSVPENVNSERITLNRTFCRKTGNNRHVNSKTMQHDSAKPLYDLKKTYIPETKNI